MGLLEVLLWISRKRKDRLPNGEEKIEVDEDEQSPRPAGGPQRGAHGVSRGVGAFHRVSSLSKVS